MSQWFINVCVQVTVVLPDSQAMEVDWNSNGEGQSMSSCQETSALLPETSVKAMAHGSYIGIWLAFPIR